MTGNNVTRFLASRKITFQLFELPVEKLGAEKTADLLQVPIEFVYKSIVVKRVNPGKPILAIIPGNRTVDLKLLAQVFNEKKLVIPTEEEAESITGLQTGGISPIALINRGFQMVLDDSARDLPSIHISGGERGLNLKIAPKDLLNLTKARIACISLLKKVEDNPFNP